jgi:hypothetical protein
MSWCDLAYLMPLSGGRLTLAPEHVLLKASQLNSTRGLELWSFFDLVEGPTRLFWTLKQKPALY